MISLRERRTLIILAFSLSALDIITINSMFPTLSQSKNNSLLGAAPESTRSDEDCYKIIDDPTRILYMIRSYPGNYQRLSIQARTWMRYLDPSKEAVMVVSTEMDGWTTERALNQTLLASLPINAFVSAPYCVENNHGPGLCCQEAHALMDVASIDKYSSYGWVFVIDEDLFVHPETVRKIAQDNSKASSEKLVAIGTPGCGPKGYIGFCGGGGYLISRRAVQAVVAVPHFYEDYMHMCRTICEYCDVVTAWMMEHKASVTILRDRRFHPWGIASDFHDDVLVRTGESKTLSNMSARLDWVKQTASRQNVTLEIDKLAGSSLVPNDKMYRQVTESLSNSTSGIAATMLAMEAGKIATLHYYGGPFTEIYKTKENRFAFVQLLFDVALPMKKFDAVIGDTPNCTATDHLRI